MDLQLRELQRELQRKIDKARPIVEQVERGELRAISADQQRLIDAYPGYLADMAEVKAGNVPKPRPKPAVVKPATPEPQPVAVAAAATPDADDEGAATEEDEVEVAPAVVAPTPSKKGAAGSNAKGGKAAAAASPANKKPSLGPVGSLSKHDRFVLSVANAKGAERKALIDAHVNSQLDRKRLIALEKEYDSVCQLRRDILSGKIAQPTKLQQSKVQLADAIRRDIEAEQSALDSQASRIRILLLSEVSEHDASVDDEIDIAVTAPAAAALPPITAEEATAWEAPEAAKPAAPPAAAVEQQHADKGGKKNQKPQGKKGGDDHHGDDDKPAKKTEAPAPAAVPATKSHDEPKEKEVVEVEASPVQEEAPAPAKAEEVEEKPAEARAPTPPAAAAAADAAQDEEGVAAKQPSAAKAPKGDKSQQQQQASGKGVKGGKKGSTEEVAAEAPAATPEPVVAAEPPAPPPPPKEIDWSAVVITKNRRVVAAPALRGSSPSSGSAGRNGARSASPVARGDGDASAKPAVPAAAVPQTMPSLLFDGVNCVAAAAPTTAAAVAPSKGGKNGAAAASPQKGNAAAAGKGGKGGAAAAAAAPAAAQPQGAEVFRQSAAARLARDFAFCQQNPVPGVACTLIGDDLFKWAVNVAVGDGPLAGSIIPLEMSFTEFFPSEPPQLKAMVDIPHPSIIPASFARFSLCMEHTVIVNPKDVSPGRGWSPAYGAFSVLSQLQNFFAADNFAKLEKNLGPKIFAQRVKVARVAMAHYTNPVTGHAPDRPVPPVPFINGPLRHAPEATLLKNGTIRCRAAGEGNAWRHSYGRTGEHTFRAIVRSGTAVVGVTCDGDRDDMSLLGKYDGSWGVDTQTGVTWSQAEQQEPTDATAATFPLPPNSVVDVTVRPAAGEIDFVINGALYSAIKGIKTTGPFTPAYCLQSAKSSIELIMFVGGLAVPPAPKPAPALRTLGESSEALAASANDGSSPTTDNAPAAVPAADASSVRPAEQVACAVTLATPKEALICLGVEVTKRHRTFLPAEIHSTRSYVSLEAFPRVVGTRAPSGFRFDFALPLLLDPAHSAKALPAMKRTLMHMTRNPQASTLYEPPFRPQVVCGVLAELLRGVVRDAVHAKTPDFVDSFIQYARLVHAFAALAVEYPQIVQEASGTITVGEASSTVTFAMSTVVVDIAWPEVVRQALKAELAGREPESDSAAFTLLKRALPKLLIGGAMANALRCASLQRAVEIFGQNGGGPSPEMLQAVSKAMASRAQVDSWETLCDFLNVSTTVEDVIAP